MRRWFATFGLTLILLIAWEMGADAHGGGTPRIADAVTGPYRLFVWTQPEPLAVGDVHFSVMVTTPPDSKLGLAQRVEDVTVQLELTLIQTRAQEVLTLDLTPQEYLGLVNFEADTRFSQAGIWHALVKVAGPAGAGEAAFEINVLAQRPLNWSLLIIAGFVLFALLAVAALWSRVAVEPQAEKK